MCQTLQWLMCAARGQLPGQQSPTLHFAIAPKVCLQSAHTVQDYVERLRLYITHAFILYRGRCLTLLNGIAPLLGHAPKPLVPMPSTRWETFCLLKSSSFTRRAMNRTTRRLNYRPSTFSHHIPTIKTSWSAFEYGCLSHPHLWPVALRPTQICSNGDKLFGIDQGKAFHCELNSDAFDVLATQLQQSLLEHPPPPPLVTPL